MFNQEKFSKIITKIKDYYGSISDFANAADIGRSYLSKYKNNRLPAPPSPKVLEKIAEASKGLTNYDELMQVCGYLSSNVSSKDIIAQNICREYDEKIDFLQTNIDKEYLYEILIKQEETHSSISTQLNEYINFNCGHTDQSKQLFDICMEIDQKIKNIITFPNNIGIPLYSIANVNMFKIGYFPIDYDSKSYIAVRIINDKMLPLLGIDDIAVIHLQQNIIDGQTVLLLVDNSYYDIAKIYSESNTCKLYFMNSKSEELELSKIKIIGEIVASQNKSAFKKGGYL